MAGVVQPDSTVLPNEFVRDTAEDTMFMLTAALRTLADEPESSPHQLARAIELTKVNALVLVARRIQELTVAVKKGTGSY